MKETKITFKTPTVKKISRTVPTHMVDNEVALLEKNGCTILKIKDL